MNGIRNGKGKEYYYEGMVKFEGEYSKGIRNGKGKDCYEYGELRFEGEYLNGKKWEGKIYDISNNIVCEFKGGKGYIKEYQDNGRL